MRILFLLSFFAGSALASGRDFEKFNHILDNIEKVFHLHESGRQTKKLTIHRQWENNGVNAFSFLNGDGFHIFIDGGLFREETFNLDVFRLVVCHELGHLIGGSPKGIIQSRDGSVSDKKNWASSEGQADYWAASYCMKKMFELERADSVVRRTINAGLIFSQYTAKELGHAHLPHLDDVDDTIKDRHLYKGEYPSPQCRLDTYIAGARLNERPRCWFLSVI